MTSLNKLIEHFERQETTFLHPRCNCRYRAEVGELLRELRTFRKAANKEQIGEPPG